ncbi:hypothetical protein C5167_043736 [Papaver somniferum]|uniref:Uncharacterized protein n=1 Tax=Papaver somniferum TaxID=3469 RepID=A0A4Y7L9J1_PAPSO|nr:uncharacterized protein LOC113315029 isoform X2 [Papaver somniferum]RZC81168.1 hypothetical protein C5167_043736 [Papaver somniferum]
MARWDPNLYVQDTVCRAFTTKIIHESGWHYLGCSVESSGGRWCNRYLIHFEVMDHNGTPAIFGAFGSIGQTIIGRPDGFPVKDMGKAPVIAAFKKIINVELGYQIVKYSFNANPNVAQSFIVMNIHLITQSFMRRFSIRMS